MEKQPFRITIENHGCTYTAVLAWDADIEDITEAMRGLLIAAGWNMETVLDWIPKQ